MFEWEDINDAYDLITDISNFRKVLEDYLDSELKKIVFQNFLHESDGEQFHDFLYENVIVFPNFGDIVVSVNFECGHIHLKQFYKYDQLTNKISYYLTAKDIVNILPKPKSLTLNRGLLRLFATSSTCEVVRLIFDGMIIHQDGAATGVHLHNCMVSKIINHIHSQMPDLESTISEINRLICQDIDDDDNDNHYNEHDDMF